MTMTVYRVQPDGTTTLIRKKREIRGDEERLPPFGSAFPPCACPTCRRMRKAAAR
ncbi:hypothetical protein [Streptomyces sp. CC228A]|uniref:hypothetical protein n=1 Tax=Streptomyces sp. CC228A TaxID=2898186 RepID=UPI001F3BD71F|nr:hypothetical protein [Streptomyces sp. CC228A]